MTGLYIHVPFCMKRCVYCDFYFVTGQRDHNAFVEALCRDVHLSALNGASVGTIYFGGGTPSRLSIDNTARIAAAISSAFDTSPVVEASIELNPEDVTASYLQALKDMGFNRVSLGIQSFCDEDLQFMNRSHDARQANDALALVAEAGFASFTADLIFGLPGQPASRWRANLERLVSFDTPHISAYALTIERKTPLHKLIAQGRVSPPPDDDVAALYQITMDTLRAYGFDHYEISSFARPGHRACHNQHYWTHVNYLGFGPSAHSFLWEGASEASRWYNVRSLRRYLSQIRDNEKAIGHRETLALKTLASERIMLGLRTAEGVDTELLRHRYNVDLAAVKRRDITALVEAGLMEHQEGFLRLTDHGKHVCDGIAVRLFQDL